MMKLAGAQKLIRKLKEADVVLVSEKGLKHAINRTLARSRWHHIMLYIGEGKALEVTPRKGGHISPIDFTKDCYIAYRVIRNRKMTDEERRLLAKGAVDRFLGSRFDWAHLIKVMLRRSLYWKMPRGQDYKPNGKKVICSNMVAMIYHAAGHAITEKHLAEYVLPRDYDRANGFEIVVDSRVGKK